MYVLHNCLCCIDFVILLLLLALCQSHGILGLEPAIASSLPVFNPLTGCHELILADEGLTYAICLQRSSNKQHPFNLYTAPSFCSANYPPDGHLIDVFSSPSSSLGLFQGLSDLFNSNSPKLNPPEANFLWVGNNEHSISVAKSSNDKSNILWCPDECRPKNGLGKFIILKSRCKSNNNSQSCLSTRNTHWDRAPFICASNQTKIIKRVKQDVKPIHYPLSYPNDTIVFYDSAQCLTVRTRTHQYAFCFRRQNCPQSHKSAFCSTRSHAQNFCQEQKNGSRLLTIENGDEYRLVTDVIQRYSNETLLNQNRTLINKYVTHAQWMWIDGIQGSDEIYRWNVDGSLLTQISDEYWCDKTNSCSGGKGRDHVVMNIVCNLKVCLASRRQSEPGPYVCKRSLKVDEEPVSDYSYLHAAPISTTTSAPIQPVYEKNSTSIYYDEQHCLTVQTRSHLYTFCLRRQNCTRPKAFCTKWSQAQKNCEILKNKAQLLTIDNKQERQLITDTVRDYFSETRLTYNGSSYPYFKLADFMWIDGIQQANNRTYLWKNRSELIPNHLWCPKDRCNSRGQNRVMLNLLCQGNDSAICLGTRIEWKPAPYACKRVRPIDQCSIDGIPQIAKSNEMLVISIDRLTAQIICKHPEYNTEIRVEYQCNNETNEWQLVYENNNFTCIKYSIPPLAISLHDSHGKTNTTRAQDMPMPLITLSSPLIPTSTIRADCPRAALPSLIASLPTQSRYVVALDLTSYSSAYHDVQLTCYFNHSIRMIYRCYSSSMNWVYVYGSSTQFRACRPACSDSERRQLLDKYFTRFEQSLIRTRFIREQKSIRLQCYNSNLQQWNMIEYKCGQTTDDQGPTIAKQQWFKLHACFEKPRITTTTTTTIAPYIISMNVNEQPFSCPPVIPRDSLCAYQAGSIIYDINGCARKVCPSTSRLCESIRCPPDRICRVIPCPSCQYTDHLQPVCEYSKQSSVLPSLCELQTRLFLNNDDHAIDRWERETIAAVRQHALAYREQLSTKWSILTIT